MKSKRQCHWECWEVMGFGVLEGRQNFGIDVSKYLGFFFCLNFKLKYCGFFFFFWRFSFYKDVNLGLQFVIGLLITSLACGFSWVILAPTNPIKKRKKEKKKGAQTKNTCFGRIDRIPYDLTRSYYDSKRFNKVRL